MLVQPPKHAAIARHVDDDGRDARVDIIQRIIGQDLVVKAQLFNRRLARLEAIGNGSGRSSSVQMCMDVYVTYSHLFGCSIDTLLEPQLLDGQVLYPPHSFSMQDTAAS